MFESTRAIANALFECASACGDKVVTDVSEAFVERVLPRERYCEVGHFLFGAICAPCDRFDDLPVGVAGLEVHPRVDVGGIGTQDGLDPIDVLEENRPIDGVEHTQCSD